MRAADLIGVFGIAIVAIHVVATATPAMAQGHSFGEWYPVDLSEGHVQFIGSWAVTAHVKEAKDGLKFNKVVGGEMMMSVGIDFRLIVDASTSDGKHANYEARVHEKDWSDRITLLSFKPAK